MLGRQDYYDKTVAREEELAREQRIGRTRKKRVGRAAAGMTGAGSEQIVSDSDTDDVSWVLSRVRGAASCGCSPHGHGWRSGGNRRRQSTLSCTTLAFAAARLMR